MKIKEISKLLQANIVSGIELEEHEIRCGFASDLMSDVLTLNTDGMALITGLANIQTLRTAEMADIGCIVFVRGKKTTPAMLQIARENHIVILECSYSMFRTIGMLFQRGLPPVY